MGYTGGTKPNPTYKSVCRGDGHTEALRIQFDKSQISYDELIERVISQASTHSAKAQYKSAVWAQDDEQNAAAKRVAKKLAKTDVPILPATEWYEAEEYHQKYIEKQQVPSRLRHHMGK